MREETRGRYERTECTSGVKERGEFVSLVVELVTVVIHTLIVRPQQGEVLRFIREPLMRDSY